MYADALDSSCSARTVRLLKPHEEIELAQRIERGDLAAKDRLITESCDSSSRSPGGTRAMGSRSMTWSRRACRADPGIGEVDWRKGFRFSTYATLWIRQSIERGLATCRDPSPCPLTWPRRPQLAASATSSPSSSSGSRSWRRSPRCRHAVNEVEETARGLTRREPDQELRRSDSATLGHLKAADNEAPRRKSTRPAHVPRPAGPAAPARRRAQGDPPALGTEGEERTRAQVGRELRISPQKAEQIERRALDRLSRMDDLAAFREAA